MPLMARLLIGLVLLLSLLGCGGGGGGDGRAQAQVRVNWGDFATTVKSLQLDVRDVASEEVRHVTMTRPSGLAGDSSFETMLGRRLEFSYTTYAGVDGTGTILAHIFLPVVTVTENTFVEIP
jgi:hypothetical protein